MLALLLLGSLSIAVACDGAGPTAPRASASSEPTGAGSGCPAAEPTCLAWDDFATPSDGSREAATGQPWTMEGLFCASCGPTLAVADGQALLVPAEEKNFIWLATLDTGVATGVDVVARIKLSPMPRRANVGVVALYRDRHNHLTCKLEVTEGNPTGLLAIGDQLDGETTSLLASAEGIGLRNGRSYQLRLTIPRSLETQPVRCSAVGPGLPGAEVSVRLSPERIAAYGGGSSQGLRIKIYDDEDDGRSSWDSFLVRRI